MDVYRAFIFFGIALHQVGRLQVGRFVAAQHQQAVLARMIIETVKAVAVAIEHRAAEAEGPRPQTVFMFPPKLKQFQKGGVF